MMRLGRLVRSRGRGFSAVEMLVVLTIIGMLVLFSIPALLDFFKSMRVRTAAHRLVSHSRLCRQVSVSRRSDVTLVIQGKALQSTYQAWEDKVSNQVRDANGADDVPNNDDDEIWVIREDNQLRADHVEIEDVYDDITPGTYGEEFADEDSRMTANKLVLRFKPNGEVKRIVAGVEQSDTLLRIRVDGRINRDTVERWYVNVNSAGKVDTRRVRNPTWGID